MLTKAMKANVRMENLLRFWNRYQGIGRCVNGTLPGGCTPSVSVVRLKTEEDNSHEEGGPRARSD